jgi:hypothetical protein
MTSAGPDTLHFHAFSAMAPKLMSMSMSSTGSASSGSSSDDSSDSFHTALETIISNEGMAEVVKLPSVSVASLSPSKCCFSRFW